MTEFLAYGYTDEYQSQGLIYLRARQYDPSTGRFVARDTWSGDSNQPMSYNLWLYGYANPINLVDPSGLSAISNLYGLSFTGELGNWSSDNTGAVDAAAVLVGYRLTASINSNYGFEIHDSAQSQAQLSEQAFIFRRVFGIDNKNLMKFEWITQCPDCHPDYCNKCVNGSRDIWTTEYDKDGKLKKISVPGRDEKYPWTCNSTGGFTQSPRWIQFSTLSQDSLNRINNVIHEMGHAFDKRVGGSAGSAVETYREKVIVPGEEPWKMNSRRRGFYSEKDVLGRRWQQSTQTTGSEVFADMFLGWVHGKWAADAYGTERANFMQINMPTWITAAMH